MSNKDMKILMENFKHYEEQVMLEQKLTEIEETNEFKLYAEGKLNEDDFVAFLIESYGEILAEGFMSGIGQRAKKYVKKRPRIHRRNAKATHANDRS